MQNIRGYGTVISVLPTNNCWYAYQIALDMSHVFGILLWIDLKPVIGCIDCWLFSTGIQNIHLNTSPSLPFDRTEQYVVLEVPVRSLECISLELIILYSPERHCWLSYLEKVSDIQYVAQKNALKCRNYTKNHKWNTRVNLDFACLPCSGIFDSYLFSKYLSGKEINGPRRIEIVL